MTGRRLERIRTRTEKARRDQGGLQSSQAVGPANQPVEANVSIFDRMANDEQHNVLAALAALRDESGRYLTVEAD
jgi:hypothetical protein